jgi:hypothetical protein
MNDKDVFIGTQPVKAINNTLATHWLNQRGFHAIEMKSRQTNVEWTLN